MARLTRIEGNIMSNF